VTAAQRARLVVALGVLNLVLATFALAVGIGAPRQAPGDVAAVPSSPAATGEPSLGAVGPTPASSSSAVPTSSSPSPSAPGSPSSSPSIEPSAVPSGGIIVAIRPTPVPTDGGAAPTTAPAATPRPTPAITQAPVATPAPTPRATPKATPKPTPRATPQPTPKPTPKPKPAGKPAVRPPCPGEIDGPPGQQKGEGGDRPCGKDKKDHTKGGIVLVLPMTLALAGDRLRRRTSRSLRRRAARSLRMPRLTR